jgi:molecular chaperone HtpG
MDEGEKERFFFQEYVRKTHATRIKEWITGAASVKDAEGTLGTAVNDLLKDLPSRFREHLGVVCESHPDGEPFLSRAP